MRRTARSWSATRAAASALAWLALGCCGAGFAQQAAAPDHLGRGERLLGQGLWEPAVEAFAINPESARAHYGLGLALQECYDMRGAREAFRRAVALDGRLVTARNALGTLLANTGDPAAGVAEIRKALQVQPEGLGTRMNLGSALRTLGESERAVEQFDIVLDRLPRAVADFEEALAHDFEPLAVHGLGQALQRLAGQSRRARPPRAMTSAPPARRSSGPWRPRPGTLRRAKRWHSFSAGKATWMEPSAS